MIELIRDKEVRRIYGSFFFGGQESAHYRPSLRLVCHVEAEAARLAAGRVSLQGNLDPCALAAPPEEIHRRVRAIAEAAAPARGLILNLGHGCLPQTPVEGVRAFTEAARTLGGVTA